jgi:Sec-independent protein secretion pathway component TatC
MNFLSEIQFQGEIEDGEVGYKIELGLKKYIDLFIQLLYGLLLVFHCFFLFIYCLWKLDLKLLINYRKIIYTFNLILATLFSPPDLGSQFLLAIFFVLFFEIFLVFTFIFKEYKKIKP